METIKPNDQKKFYLSDLVRSPKLTAQEIRLYLVLRSWKTAYPSHETLAKYLGYSAKSTGWVKVLLNRLKQKGLLTWKKKYFSGTNWYFLNQLEKEPIDRPSNQLENKLSISSKKSPLLASTKATSMYKISSNKTNIYQEEFRVRRVKYLFPPLGEEEIKNLIRRFPDRDIISVALRVKQRQEEGVPIGNLQGYLITCLQSESSEDLGVVNAKVRRHILNVINYDWDFVTIDRQTTWYVASQFGEPYDDEIKLAEYALGSSLNPSMGIACEQCVVVGVTKQMGYFSTQYRNGRILCSDCSKAKEFLEEKMAQRKEELEKRLTTKP